MPVHDSGGLPDLNWKSVWNRRVDGSKTEFSLGELISINGFDSGCGRHSTDSWLEMTRWFVDLMKISDTKEVLEVGCGAGAFLAGIKHFSNPRFSAYDYSERLIAIAKATLVGDFATSEATIMPFSHTEFDVVFSHSVFHYFPNLNYAARVIEVMASALKPGGKIALLDLNDATMEEYYHTERRKSSQNSLEYDRRYRDHPHLFFSRNQIDVIMRSFGLINLEFPDHPVREYMNRKFRFNVIATKKG